MMRLTVGRWAAAGGGVAAIHVLAWPYTAMAVAAAIVYRLFAERSRRETLITLISRAPANTVVIMEKGPGGPAMWIRVGDGTRPPQGEARGG
jgi:hypothetical protein